MSDRPDFSRRRTVATTAGTLDSGRLPEFMQTGDSKSIPDSVTARGFQAGMPVAYEPEPTPRKKQLGPTATTSHVEDSSASSAAAASEKPSINRRSTMPSGKALAHMSQSPPLLYPTLTPSCDLCSSDLGDTTSHCSHIWCEECELHLCGSEAIDDGMTASHESSSASIHRSGSLHNMAKPKACNYRIHRHTVMQGHVRIPASTQMHLEKLLRIEHVKEESDRKSKKQLILEIFALAMKGVQWQYNSLTKPTEWIDFDAHTCDLLETKFIQEETSKTSSKQELKLGEQYEVYSVKRKKSVPDAAAVGSSGSTSAKVYFMLNTLTMKKTPVRRLDAHSPEYESMRQSDATNIAPGQRPNSRPTSASRSHPVAPATPTSTTLNNGTKVPSLALHLADGSLSNQGTPSANASTGLGSPASITPSNATGGGGSFSPLSTSRSIRPALQRHASLDVRMMHNYAEWTEEQWRAFAKETKKLTADSPGAVGHELQEVQDEAYTKEFLLPLFEMERGNPLLLAIYHNAFTAVLSLLKKGYSANSITSWTKLSALQLACMNGNYEVASTLLEFHADATWKSPTSSILAIEYAVKSGCVPLVKQLLELRKQDSTPKKCLAYSDLLLRQQRKSRNKKRSTWKDIGEEEEGGDGTGEDGLSSIKKSSSQQTSKKDLASPTPKSPQTDDLIGELHDPDAKLYPHLLTEALNVPPILAHSTGVVELLLEAMLDRAFAANNNEVGAIQPEFELSRYQEWLSICVSSSSFERLKFLLQHRQKYTAHLEQLDEMSEDYSENLTDPRYATSVLKEQCSLDSLFFQACHQHPASAVDEEREEEDQQSIHVDSPASHDDDPSSSNNNNKEPPESHPFDLLNFLLASGANINHIETDKSEGTELSPLFMSLRDRKIHLTKFLIEHGANVDEKLRVVRLDLPEDHVAGEDEESHLDESDGELRWFRLMDWWTYFDEECGATQEEVNEWTEALETAKIRRHEKAKAFVQTILQVTRWMAGLPAAELTSPTHFVPPASTSPTRLSAPFSVKILHVLSSFCFGHHALNIDSTVSATGVTLSRPASPIASP